MSRLSQRAPATPFRPSARSEVARVPTVPTQDAALQEKLYPLIRRSLESTIQLFENEWMEVPPDDPEARELSLSEAARRQYGPVMDHADQAGDDGRSKKENFMSKALVLGPTGTPSSQSLVPLGSQSSTGKLPKALNTDSKIVPTTGEIVPRKPIVMPKPAYHPPWKLMRVISSHTGWVRSLAVDPSNEWFASGGNDRLIKIWDLARGTLKVSLTGHISPVRGLAISSRHPYLFSCGEDKTVKCWDLEKNMVIRHYHGHLNGVYCLSLHPVLDILVTGGRDKVARVWDMRTKVQIHALSKHDKDIFSVQCQEVDPQVITGSHDTTVVLWDLVAGKAFKQLTNHKKSVRAIHTHPKLRMFASAATDNIKQWILPEGDFVQNFSGHNTIINCLAINEDNVMVSGGNEGSMHFWDWKTGTCFQKIQVPPQPGSLDSERGIFALAFDRSGTRLITGEADKTIKIFKVDDDGEVSQSD